MGFSDDIKNLLKSILSHAYRLRLIVLTIRFWFKVDHCFPIMSYGGLVYCKSFNRWLGSHL